ncbi:MAG: IS66 family insertion sequence element accessory protein TnpB [Oscillospiraceae bacterium]|jgi:transposase|nr:IS66 family insertion sequence element accessory protein TnpB [Oscillospiraceae bacterium]
MLGDITVVDQIYVACGYTDMRKSIDGLVTLVHEHFNMDPYEPALFLFCGRKADRIKALMWENDGFVLLYKRLESGKFQWPRIEDELQPITWQQFRWLMEGLQVEQKHSIKPAPRGAFY